MRYWLSFDLGLRGNYESLYAWLDAMGAKECGDSVATIVTEKTREEIKQELSELLGSEKARIYLIDKQKGEFILGKRKVAPWSGYGEALLEVAEDI